MALKQIIALLKKFFHNLYAALNEAIELRRTLNRRYPHPRIAE